MLVSLYKFMTETLLNSDTLPEEIRKNTCVANDSTLRAIRNSILEFLVVQGWKLTKSVQRTSVPAVRSNQAYTTVGTAKWLHLWAWKEILRPQVDLTLTWRPTSFCITVLDNWTPSRRSVVRTSRAVPNASIWSSPRMSSNMAWCKICHSRWSSGPMVFSNAAGPWLFSNGDQITKQTLTHIFH